MDNAGNIGHDTTTNELIVDTTSPAISVTTRVENVNKPTVNGTLNAQFAAKEIASMSVVVGGQTLTAAVNGVAWSAMVPKAMADGTYDVQATATTVDGFSGNVNATGALVVDTATPTVTVNSLLTNDSTPTLTGTVNDPAPSSGFPA